MLTDDEVFGVAKKIAELRVQCDNTFKAGVEVITETLTVEEKQTSDSLAQALIRRPRFLPKVNAALSAGAQMLHTQTGPSPVEE